MSNKIISVLCVVAVMVSIISLIYKTSPVSQSTDTFENIVKTKQLTVCYVSWPPSIEKDPNSGQLSGFLIDVIEGIAEDAELALSYVESSWGGFPADLASGKCHAGIAGFYPLINRSMAVSFTRPFFYAGNNGVVRAKDNRIRTTADLNSPNLRIAVLQGEYADVYAKKYFSRAQLITLPATADNTAPLVAVSSGQADVGLIVADVVDDYTKTHPEVRRVFTEPYSTTPITWVVRPGDQKLLNFLNNAINYLEATGELDALSHKYQSSWYTEKKEYQLWR